MKYLAVTLFLICMFVSFGQSQAVSPDSTLSQAWRAFANNNRADAKTLFQTALKNDPHNAGAYAGLIFLKEYETDYAGAWQTLIDGTRFQDNMNAFLYANLRSSFFAIMDIPSVNITQYLQETLKQPGLDPLLVAVCYELLGNYYEHRGDIPKAREMYSHLNTVNTWSVIGPFENISGSGYDKQYPPETEFDSSVSYPGKNGIPTHWFNVTKSRNDRWVDFLRYFGFDNSTFYGNTFVYSPKKQVVRIRVGTSGSVKVFLNDEQVLEYIDENNNDLDTYIVQTELQEGWNRLLIKCGYSTITRCNFMVRLTDGNGQPIEGIKTETAPHTYTKTPHAPDSTIVNFSELYYQQQIKQHPDRIENYILLAKSYLLNDKAVEAELTLRDALKIAPDCGILYFYLIEAYTRGEKNDEVFSSYEKLSSLDPHAPPSLVYKINRSLANDKLDDAQDFINQLAAVLPDSQAYYSLLIQLYAKKNEEDRIIDINHRAYLKYPYIWDFAYLEATSVMQTTKDMSKALEIMQQHLKYTYGAEALTQIASLYLGLSDSPNWEKTYEKLFDLDPAGTGFYSKKADVYLTLKNYEGAEKYINMALELCPGNPEYLSTKGDIYRAEHENDKAKIAYSSALRYSPTRYNDLRALRELQGKRSILSNFPVNNIDSLIHAAPNGDQYANDDAIILLLDTRRVVYQRGASEKSEEYLIKVFNNNGIDAMKEYWITSNSYNEKLTIEEASVIKKDGSKIKADVDGNHLVFKSLEANDCVYMKWHLENYYTGSLSQHFWDNIDMSSYFPAERISYSLLIPDSIKFQYRTLNFNDTPARRTTDDGTIYQWDVLNDPGMETEIGMPPFDDVGKQLCISTIPDWSYLIDWYSSVAGPKTRATFEIKDQVQQLFANKEYLTDDEKIKIIYDFITENIRYSSVSFRQSALIPQNARAVLVNKIGDCKDVATLGLSMLKEVGIKADYVLVQTTDGGKNVNVLPSIAFNHCIVRAETKAGERFIDFTAYNYPYMTIPFPDKKAFCLVINPAFPQPRNIEQSQQLPSNISRSLGVDISNDDTLIVADTTTRVGEACATFRSWLRNKGQKDKEKEMTELMAKDFQNLKLTSFDTGNLDSLGSSLSYTFGYNVPNYVTEAGKLKLFKIPWDDHLVPDQGLSYESRKYSYQWGNFDTLVDIVVIKLPKGYKPSDLPKKVSYSDPAAEYSVAYTFSKGILQAKRVMIMKSSEVKPEAFAKFKEFYNKALKEDNRQVLIKK